MTESLLIDRKRGVNPPDSFKNMTDGSWYVSYKVNNDMLWDEIKQGTYTGFSWQGFFDFHYKTMAEEKDLTAIINQIIQN
jgi:hypothetical protein